MSSSRNFLFGLLIILVGALLLCNCEGKRREGYRDVYRANLNGTLTRPTFSSNLDPRNMDMRSDPYSQGGYVKGTAPPTPYLASDNKVATYRSGVVSPTSDSLSTPSDATPVSTVVDVPSVGDQTQNPVSSGTYNAGMNDALSYIEFIDSDYDGLPSSAGVSSSSSSTSSNTDYNTLDADFAKLGSDGTFQAAQNQSTKKYKESLHNRDPDTLKYTTPQELLPAPDMRQPLMRDPSDPSNFMYDRTIFAPLKKRNHNEADRIRGDLDIAPVKSGWFDIATVPQVDLVKGYLGYYKDIEQYQDLQDISYTRARNESMGVDSSESTKKMTAVMEQDNREMMRPSLKYASPPKLEFGPVGNTAYTNSNPWYNTTSGRLSNSQFQL